MKRRKDLAKRRKKSVKQRKKKTLANLHQLTKIMRGFTQNNARNSKRLHPLCDKK